VVRRIEGEAAHRAERADEPSVERRAERIAPILEEPQAAPRGDRDELLDVQGISRVWGAKIARVLGPIASSTRSGLML
jgi:hypothetical protein